jgi:hypothetical protein
MTKQEQAIVEQITRDFHTYDAETIKVLKGRLTLNMYVAAVSEALAPLVLGLTEESAEAPIKLIDTIKDTHYNTVTQVNGRILRDAADDAFEAFAETLTAEERAELAAFDTEETESFEYVDSAADAVYAEYQMETDQTVAQFREYIIYNVRDEAGHRPIRESRYTDAYMTAHVAAYQRHKRAQAFVKGAARKLKDRRYHDIEDICLGAAGQLLGRSKQATAHAKAKAQSFKDVAGHLTQAQQKKVRRAMASKGIDVAAAVALIS